MSSSELASMSVNEAQFEIPELPQGEQLRFVLLSNWGDPLYVGLKSIEIFMETGEKAVVASINCTSASTFGDINSLVRIDESFDTNRWFCNMGEEPIELILQLEKKLTIAMIRVWNYNESRVHAQRGVREMLIFLDGRAVFRGEMNPAFDSETEYEPMGDTILFTTDECILESIAKHDTCLIGDLTTLTSSSIDVASEDNDEANRLQNSNNNDAKAASESLTTPFRPSTTERKVHSAHKNFDAPRPSSAREEKDEKGVARVIHLELNSNWGCQNQIGFTGIEFIHKNGQPINVKDHATITSTTGDTLVLERLLNGKNLTRNAEDMCLLEFDPQKPTTITIQFDQPFHIAGISFWNYNASTEMSYAGVKLMQIYINGKISVGNVILRKAPGSGSLKILETYKFRFRLLRLRPRHSDRDHTENSNTSSSTQYTFDRGM
ncbi:hypothetical protein WR25_08218 isoform B [Diploscapter pachys]|uniref:KATNIP domain-containing protein n=1 Tax=Diploscapter pachys TaxID=2018661 RepID=A0A2A2L8N3_9BILA|nr:hypothetical protein WR25_08218 isoform B [Diploscapter pachys]